MAKVEFHLPNLITIGRLTSVPILLVLMLFLDDSSPDVKFNMTLSVACAILFAIAMSTDVLDGYLARKYEKTSVFGKLVDPLADKMLFIAAMIMMIQIGRIPAWLVTIFFIREVAVTALRGIAANEGVIISASNWGKYKAAFGSSATVGLLLHYPFWGIHWHLIGWLLMIPALIFSIASGIQYAWRFFREMEAKTA